MATAASVAAAATSPSSYGCSSNTPPRRNGSHCSSTCSPISAFSTIKTPRIPLHVSSHNPLPLFRRYGSLPSTFVGLKHWGGISIQFGTSRRAARRGVGCRGSTVRASLFGVGAPEALVIGVVALLVFGPKGLAEVARTLGKTLRAFQPTIREIQEVSRDFKSTLEREIGLDEVQSSLRDESQPYKLPYSKEELLKAQGTFESAAQARGTDSEAKPPGNETTATGFPASNAAAAAAPEASQTGSIPPTLDVTPTTAVPATDSSVSTTQSPSSMEESQSKNNSSQ